MVVVGGSVRCGDDDDAMNNDDDGISGATAVGMMLPLIVSLW